MIVLFLCKFYDIYVSYKQFDIKFKTETFMPFQMSSCLIANKFLRWNLLQTGFMDFISNNSCIHRTSAFHIWFTFKKDLLWLFAFVPFCNSLRFIRLYLFPFSSFEAYTYFYLIKDFVRFSILPSFSHFSRVFFI